MCFAHENEMQHCQSRPRMMIETSRNHRASSRPIARHCPRSWSGALIVWLLLFIYINTLAAFVDANEQTWRISNSLMHMNEDVANGGVIIDDGHHQYSRGRILQDNDAPGENVDDEFEDIENFPPFQQSYRPRRQKPPPPASRSAEHIQPETMIYAEMYAQMNRLALTCRSERGVAPSFNYYMLDTCARCYHYMPTTTFRPRARFLYVDHGRLHDPHRNLTIYPNDTERLLETFASPIFAQNWQECCVDAIGCCLRLNHKYYQADGFVELPEGGREMPDYEVRHRQSHRVLTMIEDRYQCPPTWDGWLCWDEPGRPGEWLERSCPGHIYHHHRAPSCGSYVRKLCNLTGGWFVNKEGKEWTDFTACAGNDLYGRRLMYSLITNVISVLALAPALFVFTHYNQLSSLSRIRVHVHLFSSLLIYSFISAVLKGFTLLELHQTNAGGDEIAPEVEIENIASPPSNSTATYNTSSPSVCLILSILARYFRSTNYFWMFNEALFLHKLLKYAFSTPPLRSLIIFAYSVPLITTTTYIVVRTMDEDQGMVMAMANRTMAGCLGDGTEGDCASAAAGQVENIDENIDSCWLMPSTKSWHEWIINVPNCATLIINLFFLGWLLKVLYIKTNATVVGVPAMSSSVRRGDGNNANESLVMCSDNGTVNGATIDNNNGIRRHQGSSSSSGGHQHPPTHSKINKQSILVSLRAAILLLPLFGLHYLLIVYRPRIENCFWSETYHYLALSLDGLQGLVVAIIFCFINGEIRHLVRRTIQRVGTRNRSTTIYMTDLAPTAAPT